MTPTTITPMTEIEAAPLQGMSDAERAQMGAAGVLTEQPLNTPTSDPVEAAIADLLTALGADEGDHTANTPARVAKAWRYMLNGYTSDPAAHLLKQFTAPENPGLVMVSGIRVTSTCAHHLLPVTGTATVAYRPQPGQNVVGLSKLARVVDGFSRRLQVQERIGSQVVDALMTMLHPEGAACVITAGHGCMTLRGVEQSATETTTVAAGGDWLTVGSPDMQMVMAEHNRHV